ncbi:MAG TPA: Stp1/IreP family PP2C-type Ser/Thr phosphatase [Streptosporangiaceae bacterium]|nr:Stp1/IreP family PP2C-type Ser/Thr phosphatase [Streptosporangiaceae bacterium]
MTLALRYAIRSDVGLLREGNEDSAYAGPHLLAIADGMGGHAAGEVASSVAISALTGLDDDLPADRLLDELARAVASANTTLHEMSVEDPSVEGMGTTLTALLWSGSTVAICHIGDSRAYLLRDREFHQITRDHTLVQSLVDDGRLSPAQAATHPQRSLVMRALQSGTEAEPDLSTIEARAGDRFLLCSDGLSDVVSEETLRETLIKYGDRDQAVNQLIELAIRGGGPDNITCIVADAVDSDAGPATGQVSMLVGAASNGDGRPRLRNDSPAGRAHLLTQAGAAAAGATSASRAAGPPSPPRAADEDGGGRAEHRAARRRWPIVTTILAVLLIVIVGGGYAAWRYTQTQYYVGTDGQQVIIYRGVNQQVLGMSLSGVYQRTGIPLSHVTASDLPQVRSTIPGSSLSDAQKTVNNIRQAWTCQQYVAAYNTWLVHKPKPVKTTKKEHGKTVTVTTTPAYKPAPAVPKGCTPQGTTG